MFEVQSAAIESILKKIGWIYTHAAMPISVKLYRYSRDACAVAHDQTCFCLDALIETWGFSVVNVIGFGFAFWQVSNESGSSHISHIGGLLCGLFPAILMLPNFKKEDWEAKLPFIAFAVFIVFFVVFPILIYQIVVPEMDCVQSGEPAEWLSRFCIWNSSSTTLALEVEIFDFLIHEVQALDLNVFQEVQSHGFCVTNHTCMRQI